ncbi:MAG: hypothetical protein ACP5PT_03535 [Brevinematia bacterium]
MLDLAISNNTVTIGKKNIDERYSIFLDFVPDSEEIILESGMNIWIYLNQDVPMKKIVSAKQIKFLSNLFDFYLGYLENHDKNLRFLASKSYIPFEVIENFWYEYLSKDTLSSIKTPIEFIKNFLNYATHNYSEYFSISFFILFNLLKNQSKKLNLENYLTKNKEIISKNLDFFKILMRKQIVKISKNIFGDTLIHPLIKDIKTQRNIGIFNGLTYLLPSNKINIIDLTLIYKVSSYFKVRDDLIIGRISKKKLENLKQKMKSNHIANLLKKIYIPVKDLL